MSKRRCDDSAALDAKRKKKFTSPEMEMLLQEVDSKRAVLFCGVSGRYKIVEKRDAWDAVTRSVNAVSGEWRTTEEVKKKWFDLKSLVRKRLARHRAELPTAGGGQASPQLSELDQRIEAIIGETALLAVGSTENLDAALDPVDNSSPRPESESVDELLLGRPPSEAQPDTSQPAASCSGAPTSRVRRTPKTRSSAAAHLISGALLINQERMADTLSQIATTVVIICDTLQEINKNIQM